MASTNYPANAVTFGSERINLVSTVVAEDVNSLYREVVSIAEDLGAGSMGVGTPGLRFSSAWGVGSFTTATTTWTGLQARLQNIEKGLYQSFYNRLDVKGTANFNTIQSANANTTGLIVKAGTLTGTVTFATSNGTTLTYTAENTFSVGQLVTVTGLTTTTGNPLLNFSLRAITAVVGSGPTYTGFSIAAPSVTGVTGTASTGTTTLTVVGDVSAVIVGMTVAGTGIATGSKVSAISGQTVTLSLSTSAPVSGSITFTTVGSTSGSQSGTATAFQTTSLQLWQKSDGTTVASMSPDGNLVTAGTSTLGGNTSVAGNFSATGTGTFGGAVTITGALSASGDFTVGTINGGTP